jgi:homoserine dehydrogenase
MKVGLLGFGVVGSGAVKTLLSNRDIINSRAGVDIQLVAIADLDLESDRGVDLSRFPNLQTTHNAEDVIRNDEIDVIIETIGGTTVALQLVLKALASGKDVVTANKALLSEHAEEIFSSAAKHNRRIAFEGAVAGGIPIIETLDGALASVQVNQVWGILNGTSNYILTKMEQEGGDFQEILKEAQDLGYAESDPTLDIEGYDTAHKIALLSSMCFGQHIDYSQISVEGITRIQKLDALFALHHDFSIRLLGVAHRGDKCVDVRVHPALLPQDNLLTHVRDVYNAIYLVGDPVGNLMLYGRGAGSLPTGSAVVSDLIQLARGENTGIERHEVFLRPGLPQRAMEEVISPFYVRCPVTDTPTSLNDVTSTLADMGITVDMADRVDSEGMKLLMVTGPVMRKELDSALRALEEKEFTTGMPYVIPIEGRPDSAALELSQKPWSWG